MMQLEEMADADLYSLIEQAKAVIAPRQTMKAIDDEVAQALRRTRPEGATSAPTPGSERVPSREAPRDQ